MNLLLPIILGVLLGALAGGPLIENTSAPPSWHILDRAMCGAHAHDVVHYSTMSCDITVCYFSGATLVITECKDSTMTCRMYSEAKDGSTSIDDCPKPSM